MTATLNRSENEPSVQEQIFQTLLRTPHRSVDEVLQIHREQLERDPYLYGQLAVYAVLEGQCAVRDTQDIFVAVLFASDFLEHRHAAWVMLQDIPPHRVTRILKYITGYRDVLTHRQGIGGTIDPPIPADAHGVRHERCCYGKSYHDQDKRGQEIPIETKPISRSLRKHLKTTAKEMRLTRYVVHHDCLNKWANGIVQSAVKNYLRYREREDNRPLLEGALVRMRSDMRTLYKKMHVKPSEWVQQVLFENNPPEGSRMDALKRLVAESDPTVQAKIIIDAKLPYPVIRSLVPVTPSTQVASVQVMTPQELLANLGKLKRDGAFDNTELKAMIQAKLEKAKTAGRGKVDALKGDIAASAVDLDDETKKLVTDVTDAQLKQHGEIRVPTVLLIDKSWSMSDAIEMGKKLGSAIGQAGGEHFKGCWLFGTEPRRIKFSKSDDAGSYSTWTTKLRMHRADGGTDLGACIPAMIREGVDAEQIVIITDEDENGKPYFYEQMPKFKEKFGHLPNVVIVRLGRDSCNKVERTLKTIGVQVDVMDVKQIDKISIPNLLQLLSKKSVFDLIQEIMDLSMPTPEDWKKKHQSKSKSRNAEKVLA